MSLPRKRKCLHCKKFFRPDPRNAMKQEYCSQPKCRKASKAASQKKWLSKPENRDYFRGPANVQRVQEWRRQNPGYWRKEQGREKPLQDHSTSETTEQQDGKALSPDHALQDLLSAQPAVLLGLLANLTGSALQDHIVMTVRRLRQLGQDILTNCHQGGSYDDQQAADLPSPCPPDPGAVQLDRPPPGP